MKGGQLLSSELAEKVKLEIAATCGQMFAPPVSSKEAADDLAKTSPDLDPKMDVKEKRQLVKQRRKEMRQRHSASLDFESRQFLRIGLKSCLKEGFIFEQILNGFSRNFSLLLHIHPRLTDATDDHTSIPHSRFGIIYPIRYLGKRPF